MHCRTKILIYCYKYKKNFKFGQVLNFFNKEIHALIIFFSLEGKLTPFKLQFSNNKQTKKIPKPFLLSWQDRHFLNKYPLLCEVDSKSKYLESHILHVAMPSWEVVFMKHGASAWFHDNNIIDYRGNNNLWTINLISERSGRAGTRIHAGLDKNTLHRPAAWLY